MRLALDMSLSEPTTGGGSGPVIPTPTATATMTQLAYANQIFQRDTLTGGGQSVGQGKVPVAFSALTVAGTLNFRCSSGGATRGDLQSETVGPTVASTGAQTVSFTGVDAGLRWFYLDVRDANGWTNGTTLIGMGDLTLASGQSLYVYFIFNNDTAWSNAAVIAANNGANLATDPYLQYTRIFATCESYSSATVTGVVWELPGATHYLSSGAAKYLAATAAADGVVKGLCGHGVSGSAQSLWQSSPTGTGNAGYQQLARVVGATGGKYRFQFWWQGHADAEGSVEAQSYQADMNLREFGTNGYSTLNTYPAASVIRLVNTIPNIELGPYYYGPMRNVNEIRKGAKNWCAAKNDGTHTNGVYVEMPALSLVADPHPGTIGCIEAAKCLARAATNDNLGPAIASATRDVSNPNDLILTFTQQAAADFQLTGSWWTRVAVYIAGSTQNYVLCTGGSRISSTQLRVTLTAPTGGPWAVGDAFDVMMGAPWDGDRISDPSGNMIRDDRTDAFDPNKGRVFQTNQIPVNAAAITGGGATTATANYPITYKAPSSLNDIVMTSAVYDTVEHLTGFGLPLIGGSGVTRTNQVAANSHGMVSSSLPITIVRRFRTPAAAPAANRYLMQWGGISLVLNSSMKVFVSGYNLNANSISATLLANKVYWVAGIISPTGVTSLYWFNCTDAAQTVQKSTGTTTTTPYSVTLGVGSVNGVGTDLFTGTTGASIFEGAVYDSHTVYTGAAGSFTPPAAPLVGNEANLISYNPCNAANDTAGVQKDIVRHT